MNRRARDNGVDAFRPASQVTIRQIVKAYEKKNPEPLDTRFGIFSQIKMMLKKVVNARLATCFNR